MPPERKNFLEGEGTNGYHPDLVVVGGGPAGIYLIEALRGRELCFSLLNGSLAPG